MPDVLVRLCAVSRGRFTRPLWLLATVVLLCSCSRLGIGVTKVADILRDPGQFADRDVTIRGQVTDAWQVPLVQIGTYTVKDASGSIVVITHQDVPVAGATVTVRGKVSSVAVVGGRAIGVHVAETSRK